MFENQQQSIFAIDNDSLKSKTIFDDTESIFSKNSSYNEEKPLYSDDSIFKQNKDDSSSIFEQKLKNEESIFKNEDKKDEPLYTNEDTIFNKKQDNSLEVDKKDEPLYTNEDTIFNKKQNEEAIFKNEDKKDEPLYSDEDTIFNKKQDDSLETDNNSKKNEKRIETIFDNIKREEYTSLDSKKDSLETVFDQQSRTLDNELYDNHQNKAFNIKANNLGNIGVIERMYGLVARREDMSFDDISLAEMYKDKALDTRAMGGMYTYTLSDIYTDKTRYLATQGALRFGGMIPTKDDKPLLSIFDKNETIFDSNKDNSVFKKQNIMELGSNEKYMSSPGLGQTGTIEENTIYSLDEDNEDKKDLKEENEKNSSMKDLLKDIQNTNVEDKDLSKVSSIFMTNKDIDYSGKTKSAKKNKASSTIQKKESVMSNHFHIEDVQSRKELASEDKKESQYIQEQMVSRKDMNTDKNSSNTDKMQDLIKKEVSKKREIKESKEQEIDTLKETRITNSEKFEKSTFKDEQKKLEEEKLKIKRKDQLRSLLAKKIID